MTWRNVKAALGVLGDVIGLAVLGYAAYWVWIATP